ncbi:MAG: helix-turn-helix domain-containing protein [Oscillospiraceae bacterium]|nr:helix-turn-helix domain-containing protein [Oscillospiraceae bacterium]
MTYSPFYIHIFRFLSNRHLSGAQKFLYENPDPDKLAAVSNKLKWYRYQNGLLQSDVAKAMEIDRSTYSQYEEKVLDAYPLDKLEKAAAFFGIDVTSLLDEYNLFLYKGQGEQINRLRQSLHLTQSEFAGRLNVSLKAVQRWEQDKVRIQKGTFKRLKEMV